ncbi:MAG: Type II secretory pathway, pseudopilin PulG [Verrucomicrobia bacterium]|jgi:prepilin-type N-terminal cleavage/methylation domain-containing protein|nr:MAG: Type II secretory pathway, pseudopilin PulG [Verrucomicrobiota bacterium]
MKNSFRFPERFRGFTFLEVIIVVAVIGIMSALAISAFSNGAADAREIVARQQQATVQSAVNAWVCGRLTGNLTVEEVRSAYNAVNGSEARLTLIRDYLDDVSYGHFVSESTSAQDRVESAATRRLGWYISMPNWTSGSYPKVELVRS